MPHEHPEQQALRLKLYQAFLAARDDAPIAGAFMPYNWTALPDPISVLWLPYAQMLDEFARQLANAVNRLTHQVHQLRAWSQVVRPLSDHDKMEATHEFIETLATAALSSPYVIKSRFSYAAAHLCHQANMAKDLAGWEDKFPSERAIYLNHAAPFGKGMEVLSPIHALRRSDRRTGLPSGDRRFSQRLQSSLPTTLRDGPDWTGHATRGRSDRSDGLCDRRLGGA